MIKTIFKYGLICIVMLSMFIGCERILKGPRPEQTEQPKEKQKDAVNPLSLSEDFEIIPEKYPMASLVDTVADSQPGLTGTTGDTTSSVTGSYETYRIQLYTSKTYGPATREQKIAREVFDKEIYLDYEVPYYKVRAGDFATFDDAEIYLPAAVEAGYKNAWVVKVTVNVRQLEQSYDEFFPPLIDPLDTGAIIPEQINEKPEYPEN